MMDFTRGIKVILDNKSKNPECPHGKANYYLFIPYLLTYCYVNKVKKRVN